MLEDSTSVPILVGSVFLLVGILMFLFPPKKINYLYGYRTRGSMKNIERWNFAQKLSSKLLLICGISLLITGIVGLILYPDQNVINIIGIFESILLIMLIFIKTEFDLKKKFGKTL